MGIEEKTMGLYSSKVLIPYKLEISFNGNHGGAHGGASCEFFPAQSLINGEVCEALSSFSPVKVFYKLNGQTRKRSKNWLRNQMRKDGKKLIDKFRSVGLVEI